MNTEKTVVKRGEIYCADLSPVIGCNRAVCALFLLFNYVITNINSERCWKQVQPNRHYCSDYQST